ncbi:hypothetical protein I603_2872 [Erythrobacter dokdonensis DSW-74]|uniref:DUF3617 domain-containing protein n=2 Tax=Erythrobacter TaxID=1041 RepID=A0A1A7BDJ4_9SPHN|nr:hypothetical protein I603_2872 [Erythrobacter dokdonensis DSW-74]
MNHLSISDVRAIVVSCVAATTLTLAAIPVVAQNSGPAMFRTLTKGAWTIKFRDGASDRKICLRTGQELVQLRHRDAGCSQFLVEDGATKVTVQYTCPGNGYGRTSIRRETPTLVQLESQGIEGGLPFQLVAEARRTGSC